MGAYFYCNMPEAPKSQPTVCMFHQLILVSGDSSEVEEEIISEELELETEVPEDSLQEAEEGNTN